MRKFCIKYIYIYILDTMHIHVQCWQNLPYKSNWTGVHTPYPRPHCVVRKRVWCTLCDFWGSHILYQMQHVIMMIVGMTSLEVCASSYVLLSVYTSTAWYVCCHMKNHMLWIRLACQIQDCYVTKPPNSLNVHQTLFFTGGWGLGTRLCTRLYFIISQNVWSWTFFSCLVCGSLGK